MSFRRTSVHLHPFQSSDWSQYLKRQLVETWVLLYLNSKSRTQRHNASRSTLSSDCERVVPKDLKICSVGNIGKIEPEFRHRAPPELYRAENLLLLLP